MAPRGAQPLGRIGEALAERHLRSLGYAILARNVRVGHGELDMVARDGQELVFVEVRLRRGVEDGSAAASLDQRKRRRLRDATIGYLVKEYGDQPPAWRVDLVTIDLDAFGHVKQVEVLRSALEDEP